MSNFVCKHIRACLHLLQVQAATTGTRILGTLAAVHTMGAWAARQAAGRTTWAGCQQQQQTWALR
jgi:hypothetical protein